VLVLLAALPLDVRKGSAFPSSAYFYFLAGPRRSLEPARMNWSDGPGKAKPYRTSGGEAACV